MINQQLLTYISNQQEAGVTDDVIKENLLAAGWREEDVDEGFQAVGGDDTDNSPDTHHQIREDASQHRVGHVQSDTAEEAADESGGDSYREPIEETDNDEPKTVTDDTSLSPIDETAGSSSIANSRQASEPDSSVDPTEDDTADDADTEDGDQDSPVTEVAEEPERDEETHSDDEDDSVSGNPLDSHEEMKKIGRSEASDHDPSPVAMRTFSRDSEQISSGEKNREKTDKPTSPSVDQDKETKNLQKDQSSTDGADTVKSDEIAELAAQAAANQSPAVSDNADTAARKMPRQPAQDQEQSRPKMATVSDIKSGGQESSRNTTDGKRRFTAAQKSAAMKREAAKKSKSSSSGSGSNWVSILIFVFALILVGGGGAYAYITFFQDSTPEVSASEVMGALTEAGSFDFRVMIESAPANGMPERNLVIEGVMDLDPDNDTQGYYTITSRGETFQSVLAEVENMPTVPSVQRETIRGILRSPDFFSIGSYQTQERLGQSGGNEGFATNRFAISADPGQLVSDYATLHQALFGDSLSQNVLAELQSSVGQFQPTQGQAWLHPETRVPYQITIIGTGSAGQDMQVNIQLKNHGVRPQSTPPYQARSVEQSLQLLFSGEDADHDEDLESTEPDDGIDDEGQDETEDIATSSVDEDEETDTEPALTTVELERFDRMRINDLQQLRVALHMYQRGENSFPQDLTRLLSSMSVTSLTELPQDPVTQEWYKYSVSDDRSQYHLGATLQVLTRSDVSNDANFNSSAQGYTGGFDGAGRSCAEAGSDMQISTCYDITGTVD